MPESRAHSLWILEALGLQLARPSTRTLSQRLYAGLRESIQSGALSAGEALPSSRQMAHSLGIGRNTVLGAVERLIAEGFLMSRRGAGVFVANWQPPASMAASGARMAPDARLSTRGERLLGFSATLSARHTAFAPGVPALDLLPRERWQRLLRRHQQKAPADWFDYRSEGGLPALKRAVCDYLRLSRSVRCQPHQILITQGAQQGFELIARLLADPEDRVWIEEPGYAGAQACFASAGLRLQPVPVDGDGMNIEAPRSMPTLGSAASPRLIYVTPSHQYPKGVTLSLARRTALIAFARRCGAWIIEDDYDSEFRYSSAPIASLQGLEEDAPVIYVGTFSKVLYPGLRLGYLVLPEALVEAFQLANARLHREGQYVTQAALADLMTEGHFARHVARMRERYRQRQACLRQALAPAVAAGLELSPGQAGMHLVASLKRLSWESALVQRARQADILLSPLSRYYWQAPDESAGGPSHAGLVLGYAGATEAEIDRAGRWLSDAWLTLERAPPD